METTKHISPNDAWAHSDPVENLRWAAEERAAAAVKERRAMDTVKQAVQEARSANVPVTAIAEAIGTTRQRVYEILRGE